MKEKSSIAQVYERIWKELCVLLYKLDIIDRFFALWANYPYHYISYYHRHCCSATSHVWLSAAPCTAPSCRLPCPSLSPRFCPNSCLLSQWCPPAISSSVFLFFSCPQSFSASGFFPVSSSPQKAKYWQNFRYIATNQTKVIKHMQNIFRPH